MINFGPYQAVGTILVSDKAKILEANHRSEGKAVLKLPRKNYSTQDHVRFNQELKSLTELRGRPNIVQLQAALFDEVDGQLVLAFQRMQISLDEYLKNMKVLQVEEAREIMRQLLTGLLFIHKKGIMHRNVAPQNILLREGELKICGFGSSKNQFLPHPYTEDVGSWRYRAPECFFMSGFYSKKVDLWAAGCILYEMVHGTPLIKCTEQKKVLLEIIEKLGHLDQKLLSTSLVSVQIESTTTEGVLRGQLKETGAEIDDLIVKLLEVNFPARLTAEEALAHPFFKST